MQSFFLAIEGAIGVGKTTLARLLQPRFEANLLLEAFEENPFLADFYADRARYAFQTQMVFLLSRYQQQQVVPKTLIRTPLIADYAFFKDSLFAHLNLVGDEWAVYERLYNILVDRIRIPDLVVFLRADTDVLMSRIATRDRAYERDMDRSYINRLRQTYERYFATYTETDVLPIDTNNLDYVQDPDALAFVDNQVRAALGIGAYQRPLLQIRPTGVSRAEVAPTQATHATSELGTVSEFLAANEAMGRLGATLADRAMDSGNPTVELRAALQDTVGRLRHLAEAIGVDLQEAEQ
jgi:deoxyadenosine/deoxycytidine kinase